MLDSLLLLASFFTAQPAFAADLSQIDIALKGDTYESAFLPGEHSILETKSCLSSFCDRPFQTEFFVTSVAPDQLGIEARKMDGTLISRSTLTRTDWMALHQNRVRFEMRALEQAGYHVTITSVEPSRFTLKVNGKTQAVASFLVKLQGENAMHMQTVEFLEVAPNLGGLGQLLRKVVDHGSLGSDTFTVLEVSKLHPLIVDGKKARRLR